MKARAAWAAVIACELICIASDARISEYLYCGDGDVSFARVKAQECPIGATFINLIEKSRLMVALPGREHVIETAEYNCCRGYVRFQSFDVIWRQCEDASLKQFLPRKYGNALAHVFQGYFPPIITYLPWRVYIIGLADCYELPFDEGEFGWRSTDILEKHPQKHGPAAFAELQRSLYLRVREMYPWPLVDFHRVQLPLHNIHLLAENDSAYEAASGNNGSQADYPSIAAIYTPYWLLQPDFRFPYDVRRYLSAFQFR